MSFDELWSELHGGAEKESKFFGRPIILVSKQRFEKVQAHFRSSFNILNAHTNYRSRGSFRHIHAIVKEETVEIHIDLCNPDRSFILNIPHLFIDVAPYFISKWLFR